ncbi:MAG: response regulator [Candidatus Eisenbacteria bacterium]
MMVGARDAEKAAAGARTEATLPRDHDGKGDMTSDAEREEHESASSSAVAASIPRGKILVVDDEPEIRETVRRILSKEGYEADIAESGRIALDKLESFRPALVLCDYRLPDLDGLQLLHRIKDRHPETEVVLFSGYGTIDSAVQAIRDGAYDFLQKPVKRVTILRTVERVLEACAARRRIVASAKSSAKCAVGGI